MLRVRIPAGRGTSPEQIFILRGDLMYYIAYDGGGWKQGNVVILNIPVDADESSNAIYSSFNAAVNSNPTLDIGYTLVYRSLTAVKLTYLKNWGFTSVESFMLYVDPNATSYLYLSPTKYIELNRGSMYFKDTNNVTYYSTAAPADSLYTFPSIKSGYYDSSFTDTNTYWSYQNISSSTSVRVRTFPIAESQSANYEAFWQDITPWSAGDPYAEGGTSEPGGGGGSFDDSTDTITIPSYDPVDLLNRSYGNRGFVHVYLPTQAELTALHAFMWDNSLITEMQKMFNNVADAVISLNLLPLDFTDATPNRGNILMGLVDSQIETTIAKQQFITLDCGTIEINEFFASYLDYSPYSKLQIYLPYIGVKDLDIDEFMNAYISVKYVIDIVSGACVAFISKTGAIDNAVVKDNPILGVLYQFAGNCALNVPVSGANYAQVHAADIGALIGGAGVLGTFLTGGMSAPAAVTGILSTAANVVTSKPAISRGGSIPSTVGYMSIQKPYLILTRPRMCLPEDQNTFTGYPAYVTMTPGDTSGYTEFEIIHLENIPATDAEKNELETLMKTGVIL